MKKFFCLFVLSICVACGGSSKDAQFTTNPNVTPGTLPIVPTKEKVELQSDFITSETCQEKVGSKGFQIYSTKGGLAEQDPKKFILTYWLDDKHIKLDDATFEILEMDEFNTAQTQKTLKGSDGEFEVDTQTTHYSVKMIIRTEKTALFPAPNAISDPVREYVYLSMCHSQETL